MLFSFPADGNAQLKILVVNSVSETPDSTIALLLCQMDSGQGFAVFPFQKSQKCGHGERQGVWLRLVDLSKWITRSAVSSQPGHWSWSKQTQKLECPTGV